jgi:hypothetical protein
MLNLVLSFLLAALWVTVATVVTERLGTKVGGVVTSLPSTLIIALYFIAVEEGPAFSAQAAAVIPAELGVNVLFVAIFVATSRHGLGPALGAAFFGWFWLSLGVYLLDVRSLPLSLLIFAVCVLVASAWLKAKRDYRAQAGRKIKYTPAELAFRGLFAGLMIAISVFLASFAGPVIGGIMSVFPAIFTSTMVILYLRQGEDFTGATGRTMIIGVTNTAAFTVMCFFWLPLFGAMWGILLSVFVSYVFSLGTYGAMKMWFR